MIGVFVPTLLFCLAMQFLGLYVASFLLIAGFMRMVGKIARWKSLLTAFVFTAVMFVTFDIAFDVIMSKGPLERRFGRRKLSMEALDRCHGFAVLMTWRRYSDDPWAGARHLCRRCRASAAERRGDPAAADLHDRSDRRS